ncbi:5-formyltetrahydrofolate cyclo-ligase [Paenarthrobacter aurescens]|uniref:5-formyltetrahydrofolate cyclo-ligase n=1 Tax=Paenarthrobacter aurescens TaxID=43663 RepID=A0A4Y3NFB1_PAEAU|nr:5-formyltetrahydrofolate cyclo-ligase [Paenarthrobacter aurescens]MDO6144267.1 5-formyltetrahydrofolate cyclo-ligase [Paenarthrobacter aurescens]MDO6148114.1 5-formyltetrahydrofolate cyclo-ligase [Paenarthrobacter aurescens]MDO6159358.1 5-formyltetrahydrofolate cyclo-ligase [Paenarthrobacter aurescens]MDO6163341.1 5-formyltetrahydrofolate cyclo-ligase [Paenarthrobacter aurescens]GEB17826.1 5-formyltetrahydrofolate cyclo-ligase [Paenarthrobacter aurescens]
MATKEDIRSSRRLHRRTLTPEHLASAGESLAQHGTAWAASVSPDAGATFAVYLGVAFEPPTIPLITSLHKAGHRVLLPVCEPGRLLSWVYWTPETAFVRSPYAPIDEPEGERLESSVIAGTAGIFMPATAVDRDGNRIGQGGGYYDRLLQGLDASGGRPPTIAVVFDDDLLPSGSIPAEAFDRPVRQALTPSGVVHLHEGPEEN